MPGFAPEILTEIGPLRGSFHALSSLGSLVGRLRRTLRLRRSTARLRRAFSPLLESCVNMKRLGFDTQFEKVSREFKRENEHISL